MLKDATRVANQFTKMAKFDFRSLTIASLRRSKHSATNAARRDSALSDDGLGIGAVRGVAAVWCEFVQLAHYRQGLGMGEETIRYSAEDAFTKTQQGLSCVKVYSLMW